MKDTSNTMRHCNLSFIPKIKILEVSYTHGDTDKVSSLAILKMSQVHLVIVRKASHIKAKQNDKVLPHKKDEIFSH